MKGSNVAELLREELETYRRQHEELLGASRGKYVLIRGNEVAGTYESKADAISEGYRRFGHVAFLVKQVLEQEVPVNFVSHNVAL